MLNDSIGFKRQYFVKDLLDLNTFVNGACTVEFASFSDFARVFLHDKKLHLTNIFKLVIPIASPQEAELFFMIDPKALPFTIIYLKDFSAETRSKFQKSENRALMIDGQRALEFKNELIANPNADFLKFLQTTYGYFRDTITADLREHITEIYTDPFFIFPYFCIADVKWDWESFENLKVSDFEAVQYFLNVLRNNMGKRGGAIDWLQFGPSDTTESTYQWDFMKVESPKRIFIQGNYMYIDGPENKSSQVDLYMQETDGNLMPFKTLDTLRHQYDVKFSTNCGISNQFLIRISDNMKIMKNAAMIPGSTYLVDHILTSGRV